MKTDLENGLTHGKAVQFMPIEEDKKKFGIKTWISVARFVKKYVATRNLPRSFHRDEGNSIIVQQKSQ